ncbi:MAG: N-acyl-L-amino acid amidohydrolase, partial [Flavobacteriales bacterium]|nr:N-acyl-L-amino acid amidohydrolase [Flavobacteriales bacterium]
MIDVINDLAENIFEEIIVIRRHIHKNPELSFNEYETSAYIKSILNNWGISFIENIADNGIVVVIKGINPKFKTIALRADFDALPINEKNDVE